MITFDVPVPESFDAAEIEDWLARQGYTRVHRQSATHIDVVQDRLRTHEANRGRFVEAIEAALRYGQGKVTVHVLGEDRAPVSRETFSTQLACDACGIRYREPLPSAFSFNSPMGACESCRGFGRIIGIDYRLAVPDTSLTLKGGAVKVFQTDSSSVCQRDMARAAKRAGIPMDVPFAELSDEQREWVVHGEEERHGQARGQARWQEPLVRHQGLLRLAREQGLPDARARDARQVPELRRVPRLSRPRGSSPSRSPGASARSRTPPP